MLQRELGRYQQTYPQAWAKKADTMQEIHERVDGEMKRGVKEKALRPEMADLAAAFFIGMMRALIIRDLSLGKAAGHGGRGSTACWTCSSTARASAHAEAAREQRRAIAVPAARRARRSTSGWSPSRSPSAR